jgi:DNA helicase-2/ATP-dependent DNA helicase PcrA
MRERIEAQTMEDAYGSDRVWVATFHSTCVRILRRYIDRIGYDNYFTIYDSDDSKSVMRDICKRLQLNTSKIFRERALLNEISNAKNELISPEEYRLQAMGDFAMETKARVYKAYQDELHKNNALDFDDLIMKTVELFRECPDVLNSYQERFRFLMVDEYQDTNTAQFELIRLLASKYQNICVVGDDDQSIYKFRGANIRNILDFEQHFSNTKVIKLEQNYRSTQNILDAANGVIANNKGRKEKALWTDNGKGDPVRFRQYDTAIDEASAVISAIHRAVSEGESHYADYAVLYRTNAQSRLLEEKCVLNNIPYRLVGGVNFYSRREIKDLLAYLKTVDNAQDDLAVRRIINVPKRGIGATTLGRIENFAFETSMNLYEAMEIADEIPGIGRGSDKVTRFTVFIRALRTKAKEMSVTELLEEIIETTGYVRELEAEETDEAKERIENIDELFSRIATYEASEEEPTLSGFLQDVALVSDVEAAKDDPDRVTLMTLHSAKGLEFERVYLTGMEDGLFPSYMTITSDDPTEMEEERRLCYVGITRAKKYLTLTAARRRMVHGETQYNTVSRFLQEIPDEVLKGEVPVRKVPERDREFTAGFPEEAKKTAQRKPYVTSAAAYQNPYKSQSFGSNAGKLAALDYTINDRVLHTKFGEGTVLDIVSGGRDFEVTVDFDSAGVKKMFAMFAKLKKLKKE